MATILPNTASDLDQWNLLLAVGAPFIAALINQPHFNKWLRVAVVAAVCVVASLVTTSLNGGLHMATWLHSLIIVLVGALGLYHTLFRSVVPAVESATSKPKARAKKAA